MKKQHILKKISMILTACFALAITHVKAQQPNIVVKGKLGDLDAPAKVFIGFTTAGTKGITDSTELKNGQFEFNLYAPEPVKALLSVRRDSTNHSRLFSTQDLKTIYIEPGSNILISSDNNNINHATVSGSSAQEAYKKFLNITDASQEKRDSLHRVFYAVKNTADSASAAAKLENAQKEYNKSLRSFIMANPHTFVSLDVLDQYAGTVIDFNDVEPLYSGLSETLKSSIKGRIYADRLRKASVIAIGQKAPLFSLPDTAGRQVSLADFRGKYVLIDFWASWCPPCRAENPNLVRAYRHFKDKGFTILGVSLDFNRNNWIKAIHDDQLEWPHVSDLKYWKNEAAVAYGVISAPMNVLIDPSGNIVAKDLRGEALWEALRDALGE